MCRIRTSRLSLKTGTKSYAQGISQLPADYIFSEGIHPTPLNHVRKCKRPGCLNSVFFKRQQYPLQQSNMQVSHKAINLPLLTLLRQHSLAVSSVSSEGFTTCSQQMAHTWKSISVGCNFMKADVICDTDCMRHIRILHLSEGGGCQQDRIISI